MHFAHNFLILDLHCKPECANTRTNILVELCYFPLKPVYSCSNQFLPHGAVLHWGVPNVYVPGTGCWTFCSSFVSAEFVWHNKAREVICVHLRVVPLSVCFTFIVIPQIRSSQERAHTHAHTRLQTAQYCNSGGSRAVKCGWAPATARGRCGSGCSLSNDRAACAFNHLGVNTLPSL